MYKKVDITKNIKSLEKDELLATIEKISEFDKRVPNNSLAYSRKPELGEVGAVGGWSNEFGSFGREYRKLPKIEKPPFWRGNLKRTILAVLSDKLWWWRLMRFISVYKMKKMCRKKENRKELGGDQNDVLSRDFDRFTAGMKESEIPTVTISMVGDTRKVSYNGAAEKMLTEETKKLLE